MADEKQTQSKAKPTELKPRIHINEFLHAHANLDFLQQAGFKAVVKKEWMRLEEWAEQLDKYLNKGKDKK